MLAHRTLRARSLPWVSPAAAGVMAPLPPSIATELLAASHAASLDDDDILAIMADPRSPLATIAAAVPHGAAW